MPPTVDPLIDHLAAAAVAGVRSGMVVGLGTGRAAARAVEALAHRVVREALVLRCVATSEGTAQRARELGLAVEPMELVAGVDYLFDGADEVDDALRMIKGRGGAMTREKIVAHAAVHRVYLVQAAKRVARLGQAAPLPIEVMRFGLASAQAALAALGLHGPVRPGYATDNGNAVVDAVLPGDLDLVALAAALDAIPGVVGHGLFLEEADEVMIEDAGGLVTAMARRRRRPDAPGR